MGLVPAQRMENHNAQSTFPVLYHAAIGCRGVCTGGSRRRKPGQRTVEVENFTWATAASPVTANLNSVAVVSANDAWAVGVNGTVLHYDGDSWAVFSTPIPETTALFSVAMSSAQNGWIVSGDSLFRWDGTQWSSFTTPSPPGRSICKTSPCRTIPVPGSRAAFLFAPPARPAIPRMRWAPFHTGTAIRGAIPRSRTPFSRPFQ